MKVFSYKHYLTTSIIILILLITPRFYKYHKSCEQTHPFALINLGNHPWILQAQTKIKPIIDKIIKNEILKIDSNATKFPEFYAKQRHLITLFYSKQMPIDMEQNVIKAFENIPTSAYPKMSQLQFSNHVTLFGKDQTEVVVFINDPKECLPKLRNFIIKSIPASLHESLTTKNHNQFEFKPHETLGRIPIDEIKALSNQTTVEKIKQQVLQEITSSLQSLSKTNIIKPTELFVYGNDFKPIFKQVLICK